MNRSFLRCAAFPIACTMVSLSLTALVFFHARNREQTMPDPIETIPPPSRYDASTLAGRQLLGRDERPRFPSHSFCNRCWRPWPCVDPHRTQFGDEGRGCFPLCQDCWNDLTPEERLPFYRTMFLRWALDSGSEPGEWSQIETAVLEGK